MSTVSTSPVEQTRLTESPWYWVYLFSTAGLIALVLIGPKYAARQSQIERVGQGRQRAFQNLAGEEPTTNMSTAENTHIRLRPLYYVLGTLLAGAWLNLGWRRLRGRRTKKKSVLSEPVDSPSQIESKPL